MNDNPLVTQALVRSLSIKDRRALLDAITTRNPGPQLGALSKECNSCGLEVPLPLTLADIF